MQPAGISDREDCASEAGGTRSFSTLGGRLCLDFANTVGWHASEDPHEYLQRYTDLVAWGLQMGAITELQARALADAASREPARAAAALATAIDLRETIYRLFVAVTHGGLPAPSDLETLNGALARAMVRARIVRAENGSFEWGWREDGTELDRVLWPVVRSAADLLTSEELDRVRQCDGEGCGWLFVDTSRNRSRRWCDMRDCGNRAKARRHYRRRRALAARQATG